MISAEIGQITENDCKRAELIIRASLEENIDTLIGKMAEALRDEREAVIDRLSACVHEFCDDDDGVDLPGLVRELRKAGDL